MESYDNIMNFARPKVYGGGRLTKEKRAAQFLGFMALSGYEEAVEEESRHVGVRQELDEEEKHCL